MANMTKQMAGPYMWGWAQQLHLIVDLSFCYTFRGSTNEWSPDLPDDVYALLVVRPLYLHLDYLLGSTNEWSPDLPSVVNAFFDIIGGETTRNTCTLNSVLLGLLSTLCSTK